MLKTSFFAVLVVRLARVVLAAGFAGFLVVVFREALVALGFLVVVLAFGLAGALLVALARGLRLGFGLNGSTSRV